MIHSNPQDPPRPERLRRYLKQTKELSLSLVLITPVFLFYQLGILVQLFSNSSGAFSLNGADWLTSHLILWLKGSAWLYSLIMGLFSLAFIWILRRISRGVVFRWMIFILVFLESALYAMIFGSTIHLMMAMPRWLSTFGVLSAAAFPMGWEMKVFHAMGAGFNEEMIFRFGGVGGLYTLGRWFRMPREGALVVALLVSSLSFSAFHYFGPYGDELSLYSFLFRFLAGILLGLIYWWRGLAVAVYTHGIYDFYCFLIF